MGKTSIRRNPARRAGESAYGMLLLAKNIAVAAMAVLMLVAGVWTSWGTAQYTMLTKGRERGTMTVTRCGGESCSGPFTPAGGGEERPKVTIDKAAVTGGKGERLLVAVKSGTDQVVRTGWAGILYSWAPFAGSLLLGALLVAGGLRMRRTAWTMGLLGTGLMAGAFVAL
jgi:hypothetical protein